MANIDKLISKDDKIMFSKILDKKINCERYYIPSFSEFLPMQKCINFISIIKADYMECNIKIYGGYEDAERVIIGFFPDYLEEDKQEFPINILEVEYNSKYSRELSHRDFLGSILGLGIDRAKVGDIILKDNKALCFLSSDISEYVSVNLDRVSSTKVKNKLVNIKEYDMPKQKLEEKNIIISSLRLDAVLSGAFNMARGKILDYIKAEKAFVNFNIQTNGSKNVKDGDIITLRGVGRIKVLGICGKTKKDRIVLSIAKYV